MKKSYCVKMSKKSYEAYFTFVNTSRLVNKRFHVSDELVHILNLGTTLLNRRLQLSMGGGSDTPTSKTDIFNEMKEAECISFIQQEYLALGNFDPLTLKIPSNNIEKAIMNIIGIRDKHAILNRKKAIIYALDLKQIREGKEHWIVHQSYMSQNKFEKEFDSDFQNLSEKIKSSLTGKLGSFAVQQILKDSKKYTVFKKISINYGIKISMDSEDEIIFKPIKERSPSKKKEIQIFNKSKKEADDFFRGIEK